MVGGVASLTRSSAGSDVCEPAVFFTITRNFATAVVDGCGGVTYTLRFAPWIGTSSFNHWYNSSGEPDATTVNSALVPWVTVVDNGCRVICGMVGGTTSRCAGS